MNLLEIGVTTAISIILGVAGFFLGRWYEARENPIVWLLEATSDERSEWRLTRTGHRRAFDVAHHGSGNAVPPQRVSLTTTGVQHEDMASSESVILRFAPLEGSINGDYSLSWIERGKRVQVPYTIRTAQVRVEIRQKAVSAIPLRPAEGLRR